ncbi:MAG: LacI family DNA-binding transcriptional regulator, partial [Sphaerochaeta sp.]|nr:LacI family DNA-binding transcriptional regulator [Sphaerochaeta sp.]
MRRKSVTLQDIAEKVGLSTASVSMILAGKSLSRFPDETIDTVYRVSKELGYVSKRAKKDRRILLIVCPSIINPYFATLIQGMEQEAHVQGLGTMLCTTYWD